jgi:hypothetical protein
VCLPRELTCHVGTRLVDEGKNPDSFTEKRLDDASSRLQATRGKIAALEQFKKSLLKEVDATFPDALAQHNAARRT